MTTNEILIWCGAGLGILVGVLGGMLGTYASIRNTQSPRERSFMIKASLLCWLLVASFVVGLFLIPGWYKHLLWLPYLILLFLGINTCNRRQLRIREEDSRGKTAKE